MNTRDSSRDSGDVAYRANHIPSGRAMPIPFGREADAVRAVAILNERLPVESSDAMEVVKATVAKFGSYKNLRKFLVSECCAW
jgi:hypothetical protein